MSWVSLRNDGKGEICFTDERDRVDMDFLMPEIKATYFGKNRSMTQMLRMIDRSMCFSLFWRRPENLQHPYQIGFCRVITDTVSFAWLCDFVIDREYRRKGFGTMLMKCVLESPFLEGVKINLGTRDSHAFYAQFGFEVCQQMMRKPE